MKRVFSKTSEVAKAWAAMTHDDAEGARTGSNTWSRRRELFSYSTPIASIVTTPLGADRVALVSDRPFSSGTSKVQGEADAAARAAGFAVFRVPFVQLPLLNHSDMHEANLREYERKIGDLLDRIQHAASWHTAGAYRHDALATIGEAHLYAVTFGQNWVYQGTNPTQLRCKSEMKEAA